MHDIYIVQILYDWQLIKAYQDFMIFYDICITFDAIHDEINDTAHG